MKRTFAEFNQGQPEPAQSTTPSQLDGSGLYGLEGKRRKIDNQRIGDFIVKGLEAIHFKIVADASEVEDENKGQFFAPKFLYWMVGQEERIQGYEGLNVTICLSSKRLIPFVKITYTRKAPPFAKIDDIEQLLTKHYGSIYSDLAKYQEEVLAPEAATDAAISLPGTEFKCYETEDQVVYRVRLSDESFHSQNFYTQALLPFFIEGAVIVEPSPFWNYFMVYQKSTSRLMALFTVYEAHLSFDRYRTKVSQVLVLPPYQRRGIASRVYDLIYSEYRERDAGCFQLMVEDAADEFQKVQDLCHARVMLATLAKLSSESPSRGFHAITGPFTTEEHVRQRQLSISQVNELSRLLKLPPRIILQINDLLIFSRLGQENAKPAQNAFKLAVKRRFYVRCQHLFPGSAKKLSAEPKGLAGDAYIWNELLEEDQFARQIGQQEAGKNNEEALAALGGMAGKIQLNSMFDELCKMYDAIKGKVATLQ